MLHCITFMITVFFCVNIILSKNLKSLEFSNKTRIVGGADCEKNYPFMVSLEGKLNGKLSHFCGGSLIQQQWVLTAAHCMILCSQENIEAIAVIGYKNTTQGEGIPIDRSVIHPRYDLAKTGNDIAMAHLLNPVNTTEFINLPSKDVKICKTVLVIGWGSRSETDQEGPEILQCAQMRVLSKHMCKKMVDLLKKIIINFRDLVCVFGDKKSVCFGDSGGPMLCGNVQYGVASFVVDCSGYYPQAYTSVERHLNFIYHTINMGNTVSLNLMLFYIVLAVLKVN